MLDIQSSSLVAMEMSLEIALRTATGQFLSGFISKVSLMTFYTANQLDL